MLLKTKSNTKIKKNPKINNRLRYYRRLKEYTQKQIPKLINIDASEISKWEKGIKYPNLKNLLKLSIVYRRFPNSLYEDLYWELAYEIRQKEIKLGFTKL